MFISDNFSVFSLGLLLEELSYQIKKTLSNSVFIALNKQNSDQGLDHDSDDLSEIIVRYP